MMSVTLAFLGCLATGAMATWGPYMNTNQGGGSQYWGTGSSNNQYTTSYPWKHSSQNSGYGSSNFPTQSSSGQYSWNPSSYDSYMGQNSMYSSDMYSSGNPSSYSNWNSDPYSSSGQYSWNSPTYNTKPTYPNYMKHTNSWKPTYSSTNSWKPTYSQTRMSSMYPTAPWKTSMGSNTRTINLGGTASTGGISYGLNQGTYKPPMSKQHRSW